MPILGYPARPEHDQAPAEAAVVFGVSYSDDDARVIVVPRLDPPPDHTCGTWFRAGVITRSCPGCTPTEGGVTAAYACPDCGHLPGCGCDCCPYALPAVTAEMAVTR